MITVALAITIGCTDSHVAQTDASACEDPHPDCVHFDEPQDALIGWHYPNGCGNPHLREYAVGNWHMLEGPCDDGAGVCDAAGYTGRCVR